MMKLSENQQQNGNIEISGRKKYLQKYIWDQQIVTILHNWSEKQLNDHRVPASFWQASHFIIVFSQSVEFNKNYQKNC